MSYILGFVIGYFAGVICHEIGHAIAAKLNGWKIIGFRIGMAPFVLQRTIHGAKVELGLIPICGQVSCLPDMQSSTSKFVFFHLSGIIVNIIFFSIALIGFVKSEPETEFFFLGILASQSILISMNLFPRKGNTNRINNDGYNIWKYITSKQTPFEIWQENLNIIFAAYEQISQSVVQPSELMLEFLKLSLSNNSKSDPNYLDKRLALLEKLQSTLYQSKTEELYMLDAIITHILLHDFERKKSQLKELADRALSLGAHSTAILQTYRSVLVESGRFDQALTYFDLDKEKSKSDFVASLNLVYWARAENGAGDRSLAKRLGQDARNLIAKIPQAAEFHSLLNRMETEFQNGKNP